MASDRKVVVALHFDANPQLVRAVEDAQRRRAFKEGRGRVQRIDVGSMALVGIFSAIRLLQLCLNQRGTGAGPQIVRPRQNTIEGVATLGIGRHRILGQLQHAHSCLPGFPQ